MAEMFHDTFFALVVRAVLGPTYFAHTDEVIPPSVYLRTVGRRKSSETTIGPAVEDLDGVINIQEPSHVAISEQEIHAANIRALQSSLTIVALEEPPKEEGKDNLLVTWNGPDDPEVCRPCYSFDTSR